MKGGAGLLVVSDGVGDTVDSLGFKDIVLVDHHSLVAIFFHSEKKINRKDVSLKTERQIKSYNVF